MKNLILYICVLTFATSAMAENKIQNNYNIDVEALNEIELRVNSMDVDELTNRLKVLEDQIEDLEDTKKKTQNPVVVKQTRLSLARIWAEQDYIGYVLPLLLITQFDGNSSTPPDSIPPFIQF